MSNEAPTNIAAMTKQTRSAVTVRSVIARFDQLGAARDHRQLVMPVSRIIRGGLGEARLGDTPAVDQAREPVGHHREHGADCREQEDRRHRELDGAAERR
jgi:hypothetical protein